MTARLEVVHPVGQLGAAREHLPDREPLGEPVVSRQHHRARGLGRRDDGHGQRVDLPRQAHDRDRRAVPAHLDGPQTAFSPRGRVRGEQGGEVVERRGGPAVAAPAAAGVREVDERVQPGVQLAGLHALHERLDPVDAPGAGGQRAGVEDHRVDPVHRAQGPGVEDDRVARAQRTADGPGEGLTRQIPDPRRDGNEDRQRAPGVGRDDPRAHVGGDRHRARDDRVPLDGPVRQVPAARPGGRPDVVVATRLLRQPLLQAFPGAPLGRRLHVPAQRRRGLRDQPERSQRERLGDQVDRGEQRVRGAAPENGVERFTQERGGVHQVRHGGHGRGKRPDPRHPRGGHQAEGAGTGREPDGRAHVLLDQADRRLVCPLLLGVELRDDRHQLVLADLVRVAPYEDPAETAVDLRPLDAGQRGQALLQRPRGVLGARRADGVQVDAQPSGAGGEPARGRDEVPERIGQHAPQQRRGRAQHPGQEHPALQQAQPIIPPGGSGGPFHRNHPLCPGRTRCPDGRNAVPDTVPPSIPP